MRRVPTRVIIVVAAAMMFGIGAAVLKGGDAGVRDSLGNVSAPWLLLPFAAGLTAGTWRRGLLLGGFACLAALAAFYGAQAFVLDLGGHPVLTNLGLTVRSGRIYYEAGLISGPLCGALGGLCRRYHPAVPAAIAGLFLAGEPLAVFGWLAHSGMSPADSGMVVHYPALWLGEMALGVVLAAGFLVLGRNTHPSRP